MLDFRTLADAPQLAPADADAAARSKVVVAMLGRYRDPRYGNFAITREMYDGWVRNLAEVFGGEVAIDYDHGPEKEHTRGSEAAAWIKGLSLATGAELKASDPDRFARLADRGQYVVADVDFTPQGAQAIRDKRWRYISPTFTSRYLDEQGADRGHTLVGAGLTNRPFLRREMPVISLSRDEWAPPAQPDAEPEPPSDSPPRMTPLENIARALKLDGRADETTILSALADLHKRADEPAPAVPEGKVLLDATTVADLTTKANLGEVAHTQLQAMTFSQAWERAVSEARVAPAQEETFRELHRANPELCIKTLDGLQPIANTKPAGKGAKTLDAPDGVDADRLDLARKAEQLAAERGISVEAAVHQILEQGEAA